MIFCNPTKSLYKEAILEGVPGDDLVELIPSDIKINGLMLGVESMYAQIISSGIEVYHMASSRAGGRRVFMRRHAADSIVMWLEHLDHEGIGYMTGYGGLTLAQFLNKMCADEDRR